MVFHLNKVAVRLGGVSSAWVQLSYLEAQLLIDEVWLVLTVVSGSSWASFWTGVVIVPRGTTRVWTLLQRLLLRFARVDMLMSGAGLVIDGAVSASWYTSGSSVVGLMIGGAVSVF